MSHAIPACESLEVEFKSDRDPLNDDDLVEALVCLANAQGGHLYLGWKTTARSQACMTAGRSRWMA